MNYWSEQEKKKAAAKAALAPKADAHGIIKVPAPVASKPKFKAKRKMPEMEMRMMHKDKSGKWHSHGG